MPESRKLRDRIGHMLAEAAGDGRAVNPRLIVEKLVQEKLLLPIEDLFALVANVANALAVRLEGD